jgi:hypothetical protein
MTLRVNGAWTGWSGDTIVRLTNGSIWRQAQYYYRYQYKYRPKVIIDQGYMYVDGMPKAVKVRRIA